MAGSGLIWANIGQGISNAGTAIGSMGVRDYEMREAARLRNEEKEEDRAWRAEQKTLDREYQDERDRMYRKTVEQQIAGNKGTGGMRGVDPADIAPGGRLAHLIAGEAGMTVPEYEKQINAMKTGDLSGYETPVDASTGEEGSTPIRALPKGFKEEFDAKARTLSQLAMIYVTGSEAKGIAEAKQIGLITNAAESVLSGTGDVTKAYQAGQIVKGSDRFKEGGGTVLNTASGANTPTAVGTADIAHKNAQAKQAEAGAEENAAQAKAAEALARKHEAEIRRNDAQVDEIRKNISLLGTDQSAKNSERLSTVINSVNATIKSLEENGPGKTPEDKALWSKQISDAKATRDKAMALQRQALDSRAGASSSSPAAAAANSGAYKVGESRVIQSGPNKGRTAVWDGTGWALK